MLKKIWFSLILVIMSTMLFSMIITVSADHGPIVQIFLSPLQEVYMPNDVVSIGGTCHSGWTCTFTQEPGMIINKKLDTSKSGNYNYIGTAIEKSSGTVVVVKLPFAVAELAECEGEVTPVIITLELELVPDCSVSPQEGEPDDVPVWQGGLLW